VLRLVGAEFQISAIVPLPVTGEPLTVCRPVSLSVLEPDPNSKFRVPLGLDVLFADGSACQRKFCDTAAFVLLLKAEAVNLVDCEFFARRGGCGSCRSEAEVASTVSAPFTPRVVAGLVVFMPTVAVEPLSVCMSAEL